MTGTPLLDIFHDRERLMKLFLVAFWVSLVFLAIGYAIIISDLLG